MVDDLYFPHISVLKFRMMREAEEAELMVSELFSLAEIRRLMLIRRFYERRLRKQPKNLPLYYRYISNEHAVLENVTERRIKRFKRLPIIDHKGDEIDYIIIHRIRVLYESAIELHKYNNKLFVRYLMFSKEFNFVRGAGQLIENMLEKYPQIEHPWYSAAMWYLKVVKDKPQALVILLRGVLKHPTKQILYKEIIKLQLTELANQAECKMEVKNQRTPIHKIADCIDKAFHHIPNAQFYISLIELLERDSATISVQNMIIDRLKEDCSHSEELWHYLAQRQRNDINCIYDFPMYDYKDKKWIIRQTPQIRLEACFAKYREGLACMPPQRKKYLWAVYIDFLLYLYKQDNGTATAFKVRSLIEAFEDAAAEGNLSPRHYMAWIKMPRLSARRILSILKRGTDTLPHAVTLWSKRFRLQMLMGPIRAVENLFKECVIRLNKTALPIWLSMIHYYTVTMPEAGIIALYEDGIHQPKEVSSALKPMYLEWIVCYRGIKAGRRFYLKIADDPPYSKALHETMANFELTQSGSFDFWLNIHKRSCRQFGSNDVEVWLDYIKFFLHHHGNMPGALEKIEDICKEVSVCLSREYHLLFEFELQMLIERTTNFRGIFYTL